MTLRKMLCSMGLHKWVKREIHQIGPTDEEGYALAVIIERCDCGKTRLCTEDGEKPTAWVISKERAKQFNMVYEKRMIRG